MAQTTVIIQKQFSGDVELHGSVWRVIVNGTPYSVSRDDAKTAEDALKFVAQRWL